MALLTPPPSPEILRTWMQSPGTSSAHSRSGSTLTSRRAYTKDEKPEETLSNGDARLYLTPPLSPLSQLTALLSPLLSSVLPTPPVTPQPDASSPVVAKAKTLRPFSDAIDRDKDEKPSSPVSLTGRLAAKRTKTRARTRAKRLVLLAIIAFAFANVITSVFNSVVRVWSRRRRRFRAARAATGSAAQEYVRTGRHPIRHQLERAHATWFAAVEHQSRTAQQAAFEYRRRYGREPPDGFDEWFAFARAHDVELPDEYDSLMDSLEPFWAIQPSELRRRTVAISVAPSFSQVRRDEAGYSLAVASPDWDASAPQGRAMAAVLSNLGDKPGLGTFIMAINEVGVPRVLVPWEETQRINEVLQDGPLPDSQELSPHIAWSDPLWHGDGTVWESYAKTCPPDAPARRAVTSLSIGMQPTFAVESGHEDYLALQNEGHRSPRQPLATRPTRGRRRTPPPPLIRSASTLFEALDSPNFRFPFAPGIEDTHHTLCTNPILHDQHNVFFSDYRVVNQLFPVMSTATLEGYSDIVVPLLPIGQSGHQKQKIRQNFGRWMASEAQTPWEARDNRLFWRGELTGESQTPPGYELNFARPRLLRKTVVEASAINGTEDVILHAKQNRRQLAVVRSKKHSLNSRTTNVALTGLRGCGSQRSCAILEGDQSFTFAPTDSMTLGISRAKAVIDVDGSGDSTSRFLRIVDNGAAAIRGNIFRDAFSDQIMPWLHYIPISPDFREIYHLHAYFLGSTIDASAAKASQQTREQNVPRHEGTVALKRIAENGKTWRRTHARPIDGDVFIYRLALEWSRIWNRSDEDFFRGLE